MSKKNRDVCFVPICPNRRISTPHKLFFRVPSAEVVRNQWCNAVGREPILTASVSSTYYCCEDHFKLDEDVQDWFRYTALKQAGLKTFALKLKPNAVPQIFVHQLSRRSPLKKPKASTYLKKEPSETVNKTVIDFVEANSIKMLNMPDIVVKSEALEDIKPAIKTEDLQDPLYIPPEQLNSSVWAQTQSEAETEDHNVDIKPKIEVLQKSLNFFEQSDGENIYYQINIPTTNNEPETVKYMGVKPKIEDLNESLNISEHSSDENMHFQVGFSSTFVEKDTKECVDIKSEIEDLHETCNISDHSDNENIHFQVHIPTPHNGSKIEDNINCIPKIEGVNESCNFHEHSNGENIHSQSYQCSHNLEKTPQDVDVEMSCSTEEHPILKGRPRRNISQISITPKHQNAEAQINEICFPDARDKNVSIPSLKKGEWFNADDSDDSPAERASEESSDEYLIDETTDDEISAESSEQETDSEENEYTLVDKFMDELRAEYSDEENADEEDPNENHDTFNTKHLVFHFNMNFIKKNPKLYVGLDKKHAQGVLSLLKKYSGLPTVYFLVVLRMVKSGYSIECLSDFFMCSKCTITRVLTRTCPVAAAYFKKFIFSPAKQIIKANLPLIFKADFSNVRYIVDCFEIRIKKPRDRDQQKQTFSKRYNCNTLKYLISYTPDSFINFVSKGYGGRSTRAQIMENCGFLDILAPNTHVMVRRGFKQIECLLSENQVFLIRAPRDVSATVAVKGEIKRKKIIAPVLDNYLQRVVEGLEKRCNFLRSCGSNRRYSNFADEAVIIACAISNLSSLYVTVS